MRFNDRTLRQLKKPGGREILTETGVSPDLRGLQLWRPTSGTNTFFFRYKADGEQRYIRLGAFDDASGISLAEAHGQVMQYRALLRNGIDPLQHQADLKLAAEKERAEQRKAAQAGCTIGELYRDFRDHYLRRKRRRPEQAEQAIRNHVLPYQPVDDDGEPDCPPWKERKAADLTRRQIIARLREIEEAGAPRMAEVVKALITQMYRHGLAYGLLDTNPADRLPTIGSRGAPRNRHLAEAEIKKFWGKLHEAKLRPMMCDAYRLLLITGQRRGEVAAAPWLEIDGDLWTIDASRAKNGREHEVPLSDFALEILEGMKAAGDLLFPSPTVPGEPIKPHALSRGLRNNRDYFKLPAFTPHDLRCTVYSGMRALGDVPHLTGPSLELVYAAVR